jgi:nitrogen fixation protein NifU and related proteins
MNLQQQNILDNFHHPQNYGKPESFTHHMRLENLSCGDAVDIFLQLENGKIINANFEGEGCSISIASASLLTEELKGKAVTDVQAMSVEDMLKLLEIELSPSRRKCAYLSLEATKKAIGALDSSIAETIKEMVLQSQEIIEDYGVREFEPVLDYIDIFPMSEQHRDALLQEIEGMSTKVLESESGATYRLSKAIRTLEGDLEFVRIRIFDYSPLPFRGYADFAVGDFDKAKSKLIKLPNVNLVERANYELVEICNDKYPIRLYIPSTPFSETLLAA